MPEVILKSCGVLELHGYDESLEDVSLRAVQFLFHPVRFNPDLILKDILLLLRRNPLMLEVFHQTTIRDLLDHTKHYESESDSEEEKPLNGEHLELSHQFLLDECGRPTLILRTLRCDEVGVAVTRSRVTPRCSAAFSDPTRIINYPLRFKNPLPLYGESREIDAQCSSIALPTLGQVLYSILLDFSDSWDLLRIQKRP